MPVLPLTLGDRLFAAIFCPLDFLVSGALIVSLGLLLAVWVPRIGRAIAISVVFYFLAAIGWSFLLESSLERLLWDLFPAWGVDWINSNRWIHSCVQSLGPIAGPIYALETVADTPWSAQNALRWNVLSAVIVIKAAGAGFLLWLSIKTFDRRMGRVAERSRSGRDS